jgi:predicted neuraminidase
VLGDGREVVAWFGGTREGAEDVGIWVSGRDGDRRGSPWDEPVLAARGRGVPSWNPVLHGTADGARLLLFYKVGPSPQTWSGRVAVSDDGGRTWPQRRPLPPGIVGPAKNKPLRLPDGRLLCPSSTESHQAWGAWIEETDDELSTWRKHGPIHLERVGLIQPALVQGDDDGHVVALCRTANADRVARTESFDGGVTWTVPALTNVAHSNTGLDAVRLDDGRLVLVANAVARGRTPLHVLASDDLGRTFAIAHVVSDAPGELSYPSVVVVGGTLRIVFTWQRTRIAYEAIRLP